MLRIVGTLALPLLLLADESGFEGHVIESELPSGYQVLAADINRDGRPDVVGLSARSDSLYWYENPDWKRRTIVSGMQGMITLAAADVDGDGALELALGTHFDQTDETSEGRVYILRSRDDVGEPWEAREIDRLPTTHRMRFLDFDRDGVPELFNSPLTGPGCRKPQFDCRTPIAYYEPSDWTRRYVTNQLDGVVHGMHEADWDGPAVLAASMGGVDRFRHESATGWVRAHLVDGEIAGRPAGGSSEVRVGRLAEGRFIATIEPWHGNQVAIYCCEGRGYLSRLVIDSSFRDGHALNVADFDGDGEDEVLAGMRGEPFLLAVYDRDRTGWSRRVIDSGGISAAGCDTADFDGDGDVDIACIGARTGNIKWYENRIAAAGK